MNAFMSWSGGKDSCLALYRALSRGHRVMSLFTMLREDGEVSRSHGISKDLLIMQAEALRLPIAFGSAAWRDYEAAFRGAIALMKQLGIEAGVFGDIDLVEHREWIERVCGELNIEPLLPLWGEDRSKLAEEFVDLGFRALIVTVRGECLPERWLGRTLDRETLRELADEGVDPTGEGGEFHTFVYGGPLFHRPLDFSLGEVVERDGYLQLQLYKANIDRPGLPRRRST